MEISFQWFVGKSLSAHLDQFTGHSFILNSLFNSMRINPPPKNCLCVLKHKKFDLPFLPCRIPSSTPSLNETRNLDSFCLKPAEDRETKTKKRERRRHYKVWDDARERESQGYETIRLTGSLMTVNTAEIKVAAWRRRETMWVPCLLLAECL